MTVTATDSTLPLVSTQSLQTATITQSTLESAPNRNENVESLLPLVPGVVRGPDGRINMKGARSTQGGWLVNSANVTDPATGAEAMNLPIDVVSSVQVISNPYDPEYGKFTGAVSSVETKAGNLNNYHFSIQNLFPRARVRDGDVVGLESVTPRLTLNRAADQEPRGNHPVFRVPLRANTGHESAAYAAGYEARDRSIPSRRWICR